MTVDQMIAALQAAKTRGLPGETTVVLDHDGWYSEVEAVHDHSEDDGYDMWFTILPGEPADSRFTPGGMSPTAEELAEAAADPDDYPLS